MSATPLRTVQEKQDRADQRGEFEDGYKRTADTAMPRPRVESASGDQMPVDLRSDPVLSEDDPRAPVTNETHRADHGAAASKASPLTPVLQSFATLTGRRRKY